VRRALADALPDATPTDVDAQTTRPGNETARVAFADRDPVYVKVATDTGVRLRREVAATRYAGVHAGVGVPEVVAADVDAAQPYLVTAPLPGTLFNDPWTDGADREPLLRAVGRTLAGVHEARVARPGTVEGWADGDLVLGADSWTDALCRTIEWRVADWFADRFAALPGELVDLVREVDATLGDAPATLLHADPSRINVHLDPHGLLDWERALAGDPAFDLVEARFHHLDQPDVADDEQPRLREALLDGYRAERGHLPANYDRLEPLYWATAHLLVPQTFEEWAPDVDRPADELAADVRQEARSRMAAARDALL
jgi:Ser/Thr protein kinase RdoA (MazF antagonist)